MTATGVKKDWDSMDCNGNDNWDFRRRLGNEAAIIDQLYFCCDLEHSGKVHVSKLVEFLCMKVDSENQQSIQSLQTFLDPTDTDDEINLDTYRRRIKLWIDSIRIESESGSSSEAEENDSSPISSATAEAAREPPNDGYVRAFPECAGASFNHDSEREKLLNLQHQNKKLTESHEKYRQQIETLEESMHDTSLENERLRKKIKELQDAHDVEREAEVIIATLEAQLNKCVERKKEMENRVNHLERENSLLQKHVADDELVIQGLHLRLESTQRQLREQNEALAEQKRQYSKLSESKVKLDKQIAETEARYAELEDSCRRLSKTNEELRAEQTDLKVKLSEAQQEIICLQQREEKANTSSSSGFGEDQEEGVSLHALASPSRHAREPSIQHELSDLLCDLPDLPSPLCEKTADTMLSFDHQLRSKLAYSLPEKKFLEEAHELASRCQESRDAFFRLVEEVFSPVEPRASSGDSGCVSSHSDSVLSSRHGDVHPDLKFRRFLWVMKKLRDENERLRRGGKRGSELRRDWERDEDTSRQQGAPVYSSLGSSAGVSQLDNRLLVLQDALTEERRERAHLEEEISSLRKRLNEAVSEYQEERKHCHILEENFKSLKKANVDLAERCHKSDLRVSELQEEVQQSTTSLGQERRRSGELEESLTQSRGHHLSDLRELWRLVQKDVEAECMEEQRDTPDSGSTEVLREKLSKEIEALREKLQKRQIALGALKLSLTGLDNAPDHFCSNQFADSPSSPLLDALAIDFFNGNKALCVGKKRACTLASLNQGECSICNKRNSGNYTPSQVLSCPSLHPRYSHRAQAAMPGQTEAGLHALAGCGLHMSSSSSSGVDVSPRYLRSHGTAQSRRRDFSRSSQRYSSGSQTSNSADSASTLNLRRPPRPPLKDHVKVTVVQSPHQRRPSYTTAIENSARCVAPLRRDRSLSFQSAIERSQASPVEETDFIETSADTTPEPLDFVPTSYAVEPGHLVASRVEGKTVSFCLQSPDRSPLPSSPGGEDDPPTPTPTPVRTPETHPATRGQDGQAGSAGVEGADRWQDAVDSTLRQTQVTHSLQRPLPLASAGRPMVQASTHFKEEEEEEEMQAMRETSYAPPRQRTVPDGSSPKLSAPKIKEPGDDTRAGGHPQDMKAAQERPAAPASSSTSASRSQQGERLVVAPGTSLETGSRSPNLTRASTSSRLAQLRLSNLAKKRGAAWSSKMAEVPEHDPEPEPRPAPGSPDVLPPQGAFSTPGVSILPPPSPSITDDVTPSLPDEFLIKLGLDPANRDLSADQMAESELEGKFSSLALAFKTDKLTLKQRLEIQERARNIAEQNVDSELQCLRKNIEDLKAMCTEFQQRTLVSQLEQHVEVLEQAAARVSSRAEVFGAVQQENRMSNAMDVMVVYVENLKRLHDREHAELEEAKKHIQDRNSSLLPDLGDHSKRSMSVCGINATGRTRRRSEVALPKVLGGIGAPSLINTHSLHGPSREPSTDEEDPKQRFQSAVANTSVRNAVTSTLRRASLERQSSVNSTPSFSRDNSGDRGKDERKSSPNSKQNSQEEEAYQKGFEAGLKMKLGEELMELREQQNSMSAKIENTMDKVEASREEDEKREAQIAAAKEAIMVRISQFRPNWASASRNLRWVACALLLAGALVVAVVNVLLPVTLDVTKNNAPSH